MTALISVGSFFFFKASASGSLDKGLFPYLRDSPYTSLTGQALGQRQRSLPSRLPFGVRNLTGIELSGQGQGRLLVFVAGGIIYPGKYTVQDG